MTSVIQKRSFTFFGCSVYGSRQFRVRLSCFRSDDYVSPILSSLQSNGLPDPPTSTGHKHSVASKLPAPMEHWIAAHCKYTNSLTPCSWGDSLRYRFGSEGGGAKHVMPIYLLIFRPPVCWKVITLQQCLSCASCCTFLIKILEWLQTLPKPDMIHKIRWP